MNDYGEMKYKHMVGELTEELVSSLPIFLLPPSENYEVLLLSLVLLLFVLLVLVFLIPTSAHKSFPFPILHHLLHVLRKIKILV